MNQKLNDIKKKALPILKDAGVIRSTIFGSMVRGDDNEKSDVDFLVEFPKGKSLLDLVKLQRNLGEALSRPVDIATYNSITPDLMVYIQKSQLQIL